MILELQDRRMKGTDRLQDNDFFFKREMASLATGDLLKTRGTSFKSRACDFVLFKINLSIEF